MKIFYRELIKQGKDVKWLATKLKVSHQAVYAWKSGKTKPKIEQIKKMSVLFNIDMEDLISDHY